MESFDILFDESVDCSFAPYSEVRFHITRVLPYCTRFGIPYYEEEVRNSAWYVRGATHMTDPFNVDFDTLL